MSTTPANPIEDLDGDEVFAEVALCDGSSFSLCRNDIDWDPIPYDEKSLAEALRELAEAPQLHSAIRERILDLDDALDAAFEKAIDLATDIGDLRFRGEVRTTYG